MKSLSEEKFKQIESVNHSALFYKNAKEQLAVSLPFIKRGLEKGEKCIYIASSNPVSKITAGLDKLYPKTKAALERDQLKVVSAGDSYLRKGYFDTETVFSDIDMLYREAKNEGYHALRATGEMDWILENMEFLGSLREYEINYTAHVEKFNNFVSLCQYGIHNYTREYLKDMVMVHSCVIYGQFQGGMYPYSH